MLEKTLIDLDKYLMPDIAAILELIPNETARKEIMEAFNEWRNGFIPQKADNQPDDIVRFIILTTTSGLGSFRSGNIKRKTCLPHTLSIFFRVP